MKREGETGGQSHGHVHGPIKWLPARPRVHAGQAGADPPPALHTVFTPHNRCSKLFPAGRS